MPDKRQWQGIEFADALGVSTNVVNPGRKTARRILNLQTHERPGMLKVRPGYNLRYPKPDSDDEVLISTISNVEYLNFDIFFDRDANVDGEMFCLMGKGTISALNGSGVADTQNMLHLWVRPYVGEWEWINKTIITKITDATDATYKSLIHIYGTNAQIPDDMLVGWTIYNKTKGQYSKIITNKYNGGNEVRVNHTLYESAWSINDVLIIGKNWIDLTYMEELYNAEWNEIVYHKIIRDLRIGFGGEENRPGLAVGYRNKFYSFSEIGFANLHSDITAPAIEAFATQDGIILAQHTLDITSNSYGIDISTDTGGTLLIGIHTFRLTGIMDNYTEQLLTEKQIVASGTQKLQIYPWVLFGRDNPRLTGLKLYHSNPATPTVFHLVRNYTFTNTTYTPLNWKVDGFGRLTLKAVEELHKYINAASIGSDTNSIGIWEKFGGGLGISETLAFATPGANSTEFTLKYSHNIVSGEVPESTRWGIMFPVSGLKKDTTYLVDLYLKTESATPRSIWLFFVGASLSEAGRAQKEISGVDNTFTASTDIEVATGILDEEPAYLVIAHRPQSGVMELYVDEVSIKEKEIIYFDDADVDAEDTEMKDNMGYEPTYSMVKGWDEAKTFRGRAYYLNPYIEKRYENYVLVSHIRSNGAFMYDISSFSNYRELERFDNSRAVGIEFLPNGDLLVLKDKSIESIDPDTNAQTKEPIFGVNCIARETIVSTGGVIRWCGSDDIYFLDLAGFTARGMLKETIRDLYLSIVGKDELHAVRDKYNSYRLRINNEVTKIEYLQTENGWIEEVKGHLPEVYRIGYSARLFFLNAGNIYAIDAETDYNRFLVNEDWSDYIYQEGGTEKIEL